MRLLPILLACAALCPAQVRIDLSGPWQVEVIAGSAPAVYELPRENRPILPRGDYWLRREFGIPAGADTSNLVLTVGSVGEVYELFLNGQKVGSRGGRRLSQIYVARPEAFRIPAGLLQPGTTGKIAMRVWRPRGRSAAPHLTPDGVPDAGPYLITDAVNAPVNIASEQMRQRERKSLSEFAITEFRLLTAVLLAFAWYSDRTRRDLLWFLGYLLVEAFGGLYHVSRLIADLPFLGDFVLGPFVSVAAGCLAMFCLTTIALRRPLQHLIAWTPLVLHVPINQMVVWADSSELPVLNANRLLGSLMGIQVALVVVLLVMGMRKATADKRLLLGFSAAAVLLRGTVLTFGNPLTSLSGAIEIGGITWTSYDLASSLLMTVIAALLLRSLGADRREKQRLAAELEAARIVQQVLLPPPVHSGIAAAYIPAQEVGGDFYQVLDSGTVVVGDVSGKGLQAAMRVALLVGVLRETRERAPGRVLEAMNRALAMHPDGGFVTCCCVQLGDGGTMRVASAGHPAPWVNGVEVEAAPGLPLGLDAEATYEETEHRLPDSGQLTLVTDGVIEAANGAGELFGFERTRAIAGKGSNEIAAAAQAWGQNDDITVVTVRRPS